MVDATVEDIRQLLVRRRKILVGSAVLFFAVGYLQVSLGRKSFEARSTIVLSLADTPPGVSLFPSPQAPSPLKVLSGVLRSRSAEQKIIAKTGVERKVLRDFLTVNEEPAFNQLVIAMNYQPNTKALEIVDAAVKSLGELDKELGISKASRAYLSVGKAIESRSKELKSAEERLMSFQKSMKAADASVGGVSPDALYPAVALGYRKRLQDLEFQLSSVNKQLLTTRSQAVNSAKTSSISSLESPAIQKLKSTLSEKEFNLRLLQTRLGPGSPEVKRLELEIEATRKELESEINKFIQSVDSGVAASTIQLESSKALLEYQIQYLKPLAESGPSDAMVLKRLTEEVGTLQTVVRNLRTKYESLKVEADVDPSRWIVLDPPKLDTLPSNYRPTRNGGMYMVAGTGLCFLGLLYGERKKKLKETERQSI